MDLDPRWRPGGQHSKLYPQRLCCVYLLKGKYGHVFFTSMTGAGQVVVTNVQPAARAILLVVVTDVSILRDDEVVRITIYAAWWYVISWSACIFCTLKALIATGGLPGKTCHEKDVPGCEGDATKSCHASGTFSQRQWDLQKHLLLP